MGELRPKTRRVKEEFNDIVEICPDPAKEDCNELEIVALIETENHLVAEQVEAQPIASKHLLASSETGFSTVECSCIDACIPERGIGALSPSSSYDNSSGVISSYEGKYEKTTSCIDDSLNVITHSFTDSGYVQSPPPTLQSSSQIQRVTPVQTQPLCNPQISSTNGYYRMDQLNNSLSKVDTEPSNSDYTLCQSGHQESCILVCRINKVVVERATNAEECCSNDPMTLICEKRTVPRNSREASLIDPERTFDSLSPSETNLLDRVESYIKLSCPNTPLFPRNNFDNGQVVDVDIEDNNTSLQDFLKSLEPRTARTI